MTPRHRRPALTVALGEPGALDEPGRRHLDRPLRRIARDRRRPPPTPPAALEPGERARREQRMHKERARRPSVGIHGIEQHRLGSAQPEHGLPDHAHGGRGGERVQSGGLSDGGLELRVANAGRGVASETDGHLQDDVATAISLLEAAVAVAKSALRGAESAALERDSIEAGDARERLGDLLPVGADVLDRRTTHRARNTGTALDTRPAPLPSTPPPPLPTPPGAHPAPLPPLPL